MRYQTPILVGCDGCNRTEHGVRLVATVPNGQGGMREIATVHLPEGWTHAILKPGVITPPQHVDPFRARAPEVMQATGQPCEGVFCRGCTPPTKGLERAGG